MISLRLWLVSLLLALPFYTYSLNHKPNLPVEDVFEKRDLDEVRRDIEKRQQIATDPEVLASVSSVLLSVSEVIRSITENPELFTASIDEIQASLSSVILSVSSDLFPILTDDNTPTPTPDESSPPTSTTAGEETTTSEADVSTTSPPTVSTGTPGQVVTDGTRTGTVGDDGTTRFCSASSYLCPASVSFGCCRDGYACGLTACTPSGIVNDPTSRTFGSFTATGGDSTPTDDATFSFDPVTSKGGSATTGGVGNNDGGDGNDGGSGLSGGAIGGIVGGVVGGIAIIAAAIVWFCLSKRKNKLETAPVDGPKTGPTEAYTGGPIPPQPQMAQYNQQPDPRYQSPPPSHTQAPQGYYQPQGQGQYPAPYGQNVSELGGAAMPYGQKVPDQTQGIQEAPANPVSSPHSPPPHQDNHAAGGYGGYKGPSGPVYELGN